MEEGQIRKILAAVDHTCLAPGTTRSDIAALCADAVRYHTASVCVPPAWVKTAKELTGGQTAVCTVIGFPNGYQTTAVKTAETADAVRNGADEIDMVINIGWVHDHMDDAVLEDSVCARCLSKTSVESHCGMLLTFRRRDETYVSGRE